MGYSDNPAADYDRYDAERHAEESKLPKCSCCGEPIQDDYYFEINDETICESCLIDNHRKRTEDYID